MNVDLSGGLPASREYVFAERPDTPGMRDAVNMWVSDDRGEVGLPRFAVEASMPDWDHHDPPRPDGSPSYNEGYLFTGEGDLIPAKVLQAPWLRTLEPAGQDVSLVLESRLGVTRIEGETVVSTFDVAKADMPQFPVLFQGGVRYRWDGEETYGMLERSSMRDKIQWK